jgi:hypothetical protein
MYRLQDLIQYVVPSSSFIPDMFYLKHSKIISMKLYCTVQETQKESLSYFCGPGNHLQLTSLYNI